MLSFPCPAHSIDRSPEQFRIGATFSVQRVQSISKIIKLHPLHMDAIKCFSIESNGYLIMRTNGLSLSLSVDIFATARAYCKSRLTSALLPVVHWKSSLHSSLVSVELIRLDQLLNLTSTPSLTHPMPIHCRRYFNYN